MIMDEATDNEYYNDDGMPLHLKKAFSWVGTRAGQFKKIPAKGSGSIEAI